MLLDKKDTADVMSSLIRQEPDQHSGFRMRAAVADTSANAEMIAIHLPLRGEVIDGDTDGLDDYIYR